MLRLPKSQRNSGQALLLILLSMAVVLTIILSILSRSITDVSVSTKEEESLRAFSAAEAGVEQALVIGSDTGLQNGTFNGDINTKYTVSVSGTDVISGGSYSSPITLTSGDTNTFWFINHDENGNWICDGTHPCFNGSQFRICWADSGTEEPAVEISTFYAATPGDYTTTRVARVTADPNDTRIVSNGFGLDEGVGCTDVDGKNYRYSKIVNLTTLGVPGTKQLLYAKVKLFYNSTSQGVGITSLAGGSDLPPQGFVVNSVGTSGDSTRKIEVFQSWGEVPNVFDGAIYSSGGLTQ